MRYRDAGVDITRADAVKRALGEAARATHGPGVRRIPGGFAGAIEWPGVISGTMLAATMDGVGTKLHLALAAGRVADAAADLVYHCADDLLVHGARPLAFLDYLAQARLDPDVVQAAVEGMSRACREVGAALLIDGGGIPIKDAAEERLKQSSGGQRAGSRGATGVQARDAPRERRD